MLFLVVIAKRDANTSNGEFGYEHDDLAADYLQSCESIAYLMSSHFENRSVRLSISAFLVVSDESASNLISTLQTVIVEKDRFRKQPYRIVVSMAPQLRFEGDRDMAFKIDYLKEIAKI